MPENLGSDTRSESAFDDMRIEVSVCIGRVQSTISDLSVLTKDDVLTLSGAIDDPVQLFVGNRVIAKGHLQENADEPGEGLAVRITQILQTNEV